MSILIQESLCKPAQLNLNITEIGPKIFSKRDRTEIGVLKFIGVSWQNMAHCLQKRESKWFVQDYELDLVQYFFSIKNKADILYIYN